MPDSPQQAHSSKDPEPAAHPGGSTAGPGGAIAGLENTTSLLYGRYVRDIAARVSGECARIEELGFSSSGSAFAQVLFLKGNLSAEERTGAVLLSGVEGDALRAALKRLGYADEDWAALSTQKCPGSHNADSLEQQHAIAAWQEADPSELAWAIEVVDPQTVVTVDTAAETALAAAWQHQAGWLGGHTVQRHMGRRVLALGDFADALKSTDTKRIMWDRLRHIAPEREAGS